jgi:hypothetical protein
MFCYFYLVFYNWEKGYERGQGMRMAQDYGRCRNDKERLKQK